ncbi:hypothetical protein ElyMa_003285900 [Elysia marginata]|uniref:Uncharacterized protein n=1 Tax=Elysia marginata TaxID=1093978 RepID=A0AAV4JE69_9GAST|nr:hypothetical protein ElyMa_003285900 [Elysia marginata]
MNGNCTSLIHNSTTLCGLYALCISLDCINQSCRSESEGDTNLRTAGNKPRAHTNSLTGPARRSKCLCIAQERFLRRQGVQTPVMSIGFTEQLSESTCTSQQAWNPTESDRTSSLQPRPVRECESLGLAGTEEHRAEHLAPGRHASHRQDHHLSQWSRDCLAQRWSSQVWNWDHVIPMPLLLNDCVLTVGLLSDSVY